MGRNGRITRFWRSLTGRMVLAMLAIHALLIPLLFVGVLYLVQNAYQSQFVNHVRSNSYAFANGMAYGLEKGRAHVQQLIDDAILSGRVVFAQVLNTAGSVIVKAGERPLSAPFKEDFFFGQHGDSTYYVALSLQDQDGNARGELRLGYDEQPTLDQIKVAYRRGLYVAIAYVALTLMMVALLASRLIRPLQQLRSTSRHIASGHLEKQLKATTNLDEIEGLAQDLEHMRRELVKQAYTFEQQALHDSLTGLPNRILLHDRISSAILAAQRNQTIFALLLLDLDQFKELNDTLGHQAGDAVLQQVALRLRKAVRKTDTVARLGGDEFAVVLVLSDKNDTEFVAKKILATFKEPFQVKDRPLHLGASIGIALCPEHDQGFEGLLRRADVAMYVAKRRGDGFAIYQSEFDQYNIDKLALSEELRVAIEREELTLHYQPKLDLKTGDICGVEALVRWQHPQRGLVAPDNFIPLAERTGLIDQLTPWVLQAAFRQCHSWHRSGKPLHVAVNVSPRNLQDPQFPEKVAKILQGVDLPPANLQIELTESAILTDPAHARKILEDIDAMGVPLSIDDFGTGYSSLAQLKRLPVSEIKIDKSFVLGMKSNESDAVIVRTTIDLAHNLGMRVVAEGVEDTQTLAVLSSMGCDMVQGYYISRPLPPEELSQFLAKWKPKAAQEN